MAKTPQKYQVIDLREANYLIKETVSQDNYSPKEVIKILRIVAPYLKTRLNSKGEIEIVS